MIHPIINGLKANRKKILIHAGVWVIYLLVNNLLLFSRDLQRMFIIQMPLTFGLVAALFYTNVYAVVDPCIRKKQYIRLVIYTLLLIGSYVLMRFWLFDTLMPLLNIRTAYTESFIMLRNFIPDSLWLAMQYLLFSYGYWFAIYSIRLERDKRYNERQIAALEAEKTQAELAFLRAQLNPHFLYNTLNFLFSDALMVSPRLADSIMALSQMLRSVSEVGYESLVAVGQELTYIRCYLKIQEYRFGDQLHLHFQVTGEEYERQLTLPPLILISLVENVFKYGEVFDPATPARISVELTDDTIRFTSSNRRKESPNYSQGGLGLANINKQLNFVFGDKYDFQKQEINGIFSTELSIKILHD
ncbi:sensor histidine kinase [Spirosoma spitsbergense]|uniref:sensor histidine kinase n=1 Tax=Spirosoma spitsbergense TaxID=431554 RepID=UPI0003787A2A|nr:histidine kinase [Spirosoma spitsbergense]